MSRPSDNLRQSLATLISLTEQAVAEKQAPIRARIALLSNIKADDRNHEVATLTRQAVTDQNPVETLRRAAEILRDMELQETAASLGLAAADTLRPELKAAEASVTLANNLHLGTAAMFELGRKAGILAQSSGNAGYIDSSLMRHLDGQVQACKRQALDIAQATGVDASQYIEDLEAFAVAIREVEALA